MSGKRPFPSASELQLQRGCLFFVDAAAKQPLQPGFLPQLQ